MTPRDWQAMTLRDAAECSGTREGRERLCEANRYGALADALDKHRDLLREIVAYCRESGHGWLSLREAEALLGEDEALKSTV